jgi:hypothetical protein
MHGDYAGASELLDESQALLRGQRDDVLTGYDGLQLLLAAAFADNFLGQLRLSQGDSGTAARLFTDGLAVARRARDSIPILISLYDLALARHALGDLADAARHLKGGSGPRDRGRRRIQRRLLPRSPGGRRRTAP